MLCLFAFSGAYSQTFSYGDSIKLKGQRLSYSYDQEGNVLVKRSYDNKLHFELFDSTLSLQRQWHYELKGSMNKSEKLLRHIWQNKALTLLVQKEDGGKRRKLISVDLSSAKPKEKLLWIAKGTKGFYPKLHLSRHGSGWHLWYESFSHPFKKHKRIDIHRFDSVFQELWRDSFVMQEKDRLLKIRNLVISRKADYQILYKLYSVNTMSVRYGKPNFEYRLRTMQDDNTTDQRVLGKDYFYAGIKAELKGSTWLIGGLYSKKPKKVDGLFQLKIEAGGELSLNYCTLPKKMGRQMDPWGMRNRLKFLVMDHRIELDSFTLWIAEEFTYKLKGTSTAPEYELRYGSIVLIKTDQDFNLIDWQIINKKQRSSDRRSQFASYQILEDSASINLILVSSDKIRLKTKSFDYAEPKLRSGFYWYAYRKTSVDLSLEERYYPLPSSRLPQIGSLSRTDDQSSSYLLMLVSRNYKYYQPAYIHMD